MEAPHAAPLPPVLISRGPLLPLLGLGLPQNHSRTKKSQNKRGSPCPGPGRLFCRKYRPFPNLRSHGRVPAAAKTVLRGTRVSVTSAPAPCRWWGRGCAERDVGGAQSPAQSRHAGPCRGRWSLPGTPVLVGTLVLAGDAGPCPGRRSLRGRASRPDLALAATCLLLLPPSRFQQAGARAQRHGAFETVLGGQQNPCPTSSPRSVGGSRRRVRAGGAGPRGAPAAPDLAPLR